MVLEFEKPIYELQEQIDKLKKSAEENPNLNFDKEIKTLKKKIDILKKKIFSNLTAWQKVQLARHPMRPYFLDYVDRIFDNFIELHGDRAYRDDNAVVCGWAELDGESVMLVGQQKGRTIEENIQRNFGMMHPEGYRKSLRVMKMAEKFKKPIITFIDTPGAYPGIGAEERGQAEAIARNLEEMAALESPIIAVVIGEGGSGGALGIGVANVVLMLENSIYSVISPEGCASILWRDASKAAEAAEALKLTAKDLFRFGINDDIVKEPLGGAHTDYDRTAKTLKEEIKKYLGQLKKMSAKELVSQRYKKFRDFGEYIENNKIKTSRKKRGQK